jgi:hypothetical protein
VPPFLCPETARTVAFAQRFRTAGQLHEVYVALRQRIWPNSNRTVSSDIAQDKRVAVVVYCTARYPM